MKVSDYIEVGETDDPEFIALISQIIDGAIQNSGSNEIYLVHINNWFSAKWLRFTGKCVNGALGWWKDPRVTLPPFVPSRVLSESLLVNSDDETDYVPAEIKKKLHIKQESLDNFERYIKDVSQFGSFFWFSGNSKANAKGSLMAYIQGPEGDWYWYADFTKKGDWRSGHVLGISNEELKQWIASDSKL